ncbi:transporter [Methanoculleus taiwanensis]|uniref:Transporter n=1 Tax=Methanoculleus taiwanensis TaxID=1550565 RepID=A0A498H0C9_9EURY|nr:bile acid:sodium symporter family protein [Methanoculleus taiwanensis]RXE56252.1 transporter [Methanoculleus taiwanensis]
MTQFDPLFIAIGTLGVLIFVITSMLGMGFSLTIPQIVTPLKNRKLIIMSLVANFVLVPILALVIVEFIPLSEGLKIGLILAGFAAGAPFLPKLVQVAKGDMAFTAGLMVLLMVVTIAYLPIVLPFVLTGVQVNPWETARSLIVLMLIPLAIALFIRARYEEVAKGLIHLMTMAANLSLVAMFIGYFVGYSDVTYGVLGTGGILVAVLLIVGAAIIGYLLGGTDKGNKKVLALGTGQRNLAAAFAVASSNFATNPEVLIEVMDVAVIGFIILLFIAGEFGRRSAPGAEKSVKSAT